MYYDENKIYSDLFKEAKWLEKQAQQFIGPKTLIKRVVHDNEIPIYSLNTVTLNSYPIKTNTLKFAEVLDTFINFWGKIPHEFSLEKGNPHRILILFNDTAKYSKEKLIDRIYSVYKYYTQGNQCIFTNLDDWESLSKQLEIETNEEHPYLKLLPESSGEEFRDRIIENTEHYIINHYVHHMNTLSLLYQMFEQRLRKLIYEEINHHLNEVEITKRFSSFGGQFNEIYDTYQTVGIDLSKIGIIHANARSTWENIMNLKDVINIYKHGEGNSSIRLRKNAPEVFEIDEYKTIHSDKVDDIKLKIDYSDTTNDDEVFNLNALNVEEYAKYIIEFWNGFPEEQEIYLYY
ncbi:TPA: hypothetical protein ACQUHN_004161 [Bacillus thuringiensis]